MNANDENDIKVTDIFVRRLSGTQWCLFCPFINICVATWQVAKVAGCNVQSLILPASVVNTVLI